MLATGWAETDRPCAAEKAATSAATAVRPIDSLLFIRPLLVWIEADGD
jgi:hypothetical protein